MMKQKQLRGQLNFIEEIDDELRDQLLEDAMLIELKNGSLIFDQGEPALGFYVVLAGSVKLVWKGDDIQRLVDLVSKNEMIGAILMQEDLELTYPVSALSVGESVVLRIPREIFLRSWVTHPAVNQLVQNQTRRRMSNLGKG